MCSIYGAIGENVNIQKLKRLQHNASDRGRDGGQLKHFELKENNLHAYLGNWRATPTPELESGELQPYRGIVHNGTIANDKELGAKAGEIDSQVLPRILNRDNLQSFLKSIQKIVGSYAIACLTKNNLFLACNYKPIYYYVDSDNTFYFSSMLRHFEGVTAKGQNPVKMIPYSVMDARSLAHIPIPRISEKKALVIASAGLDSTVTASKLISEGYDVCLLHYRYGCIAEKQEASLIPKLAQKLDCDYAIVEIDYRWMKGDSSLFTESSDEITEGFQGAEYAFEWIPARNLVMLSYAVAYAESNGYHYIALGNNLEEAGAYPDNEEELTTLFNNLLPYATQNGYKVKLLSPVGHLMKHEIVKLGLSLNTPFGYTWSCYKDGYTHCGACAPCLMRKTAFERNGQIDPVMV